MILDTSAVVSVLFGEEHAKWCISQIEASSGNLRMSTVNLAEVLILTKSKGGEGGVLAVKASLRDWGVVFVPPDGEQAEIAAQARLRYPLNLGDCFAYALAQVTGDTLLTLDRDFKGTDISILLPPRR